MKIIGEHSITSGNMTSEVRFLGGCKVVINTQQEYEMLKQAMETFNQGARRGRYANYISEWSDSRTQ